MYILLCVLISTTESTDSKVVNVESTFSQALEAALKEITLGWQPKTRLKAQTTATNMNFSLHSLLQLRSMDEQPSHQPSTTVNLAWKSERKVRIRPCCACVMCSTFTEWSSGSSLCPISTRVHGYATACGATCDVTVAAKIAKPHLHGESHST